MKVSVPLNNYWPSWASRLYGPQQMSAVIMAGGKIEFSGDIDPGSFQGSVFLQRMQ